MTSFSANNDAASPPALHPSYRPDIDGLRAIAVLLVVGFHAFPTGIKGGFIGVDIFFVISGFLISTIIFKGLQQNSFSFVDFYSRRIKRIFPALLLVLSFSLAWGWFGLLASEYRQLGKHVAAGAGFVANLALASESGYFDVEAAAKPLLHLWSLGVEEQFYIVWPFLLWLAWKAQFKLVWLIAGLAIASFLWNLSTVSTDPSGTFYLPHTRFWELLIGAALAYATLNQSSNLQRLIPGNQHARSLGGIFLLVLGLLFVREANPFPSYWALLPTLGAVLLISAGPDAWFNRVVLAHPVLVWFGLISFPLYLWHWPIFAFLRLEDGEPSRVVRLTVVAVSVLLAWLTFQFVEKPIRYGRSRTTQTVLLATALLLIGCAGYAAFYKNGFQGYGPRSVDKIAFSEHFENSLPEWQYFNKTGMGELYRNDCNFYDIDSYRNGNTTRIPRATIDASCTFEAPSAEKTLFIWGDSHVQHLYPGLRQQLGKNWNILIVASSGCKPLLEGQADSKTDYCKKSNGVALQQILEKKPDAVIVAQVRNHNFDELAAIHSRLKSAGIEKVVFPGLTPHWKIDLHKLILKKLWQDTPERTWFGIQQRFVDENKQLKQRFADNNEMVFADVTGLLCTESGCLTRIGSDRKTDITSWDFCHLTPVASNYLARNLLVPLIEKPLPQ